MAGGGRGHFLTLPPDIKEVAHYRTVGCFPSMLEVNRLALFRSRDAFGWKLLRSRQKVYKILYINRLKKTVHKKN
jgi:hypothetical protein